MNGDVPLGAGMKAAQATPPADGDVLQQGDVYIGQLDQVDVKYGGVLYAYYEKEQ